MPAIRIDQSCPPIVLTVFNGKQTEHEVRRYIREMNAMYARGVPYVGISLMLDYAPDRGHLRRIADWARETEDITRKLCLCNAMVARSVGFRFLLSSFLMIHSLPIRYTVVSNVEEAADWVTRELATTGRTPPPTLREYLRAQMRLEAH